MAAATPAKGASAGGAASTNANANTNTAAAASGAAAQTFASLAAVPASTLTQFSGFGTNENGVGMFVYKPKNVAAKPALLVASHCESLNHL